MILERYFATSEDIDVAKESKELSECTGCPNLDAHSDSNGNN